MAKEFLIGADIGIVDTAALFFSLFFLLIEIESVLELLGLGLPHPLTVVTVFVALGGGGYRLADLASKGTIGEQSGVTPKAQS